MSPTFLDTSSDHVTAVAHRIFFLAVRRVPTSGALLRVRLDIERAGKEGLLGYFQIMQPREGRPLQDGVDVQRAWVEIAAAAHRNAGVGAIVILQDGFAGAALRATVSTVLLLARGKKETRTFDGLEPASRWLAERLRAQTGAPREAEILAAARAVNTRVNDT